MSLRTKFLLLFLAFVLLPLGAVGIVASVGTRLAVERVAERSMEESIRSVTAELERDLAAPRSQFRQSGYDSTVARTVREALAAGTLRSVSTGVSTEAMLAPLRRVWIAYLAFMLLVAAAATVAYRLVSKRIFSSLDEFRGAVEQIAQGDFTPWLPPPGKDEVGWLSLALGRMSERLNQMMRSVEQGGRLAVVGEMAAYIAHEVRTPLSSIKMNLQLLDRSVDAGLVPADARISIDTSLREIARLQTTVTRVLEFGASEGVSRRLCSLHDLISESADLVRGAMEKTDIVLTLDLAAESDRILADAGRMKGVFVNLLVNSMQVLADGGECSVETQLFLGEGGTQMVAAAVSDSGPGVSPAVREEIFHPFFTTKSDGSGMGLPAALKTARDHGGDLYLSQRPDGRPGACFVVLLPLAPPNWTGVPEMAHREPVTPSLLKGGWQGPHVGGPRWARLPGAERGPEDQASAT